MIKKNRATEEEVFQSVLKKLKEEGKEVDSEELVQLFVKEMQKDGTIRAATYQLFVKEVEMGGYGGNRRGTFATTAGDSGNCTDNQFLNNGFSHS